MGETWIIRRDLLRSGLGCVDRSADVLILVQQGVNRAQALAEVDPLDGVLMANITLHLGDQRLVDGQIEIVIEDRGFHLLIGDALDLHAVGALMVEHGVDGAVAQADQEEIVAGIAIEHVLSEPAFQEVVAAAAEKLVIAAPAEEVIVAASPRI